MSESKRNMYRQGDVLLIATASPAIEVLEAVPSDPRGIVLAEGESSGHYHALYGKGARLMRYKDSPGRVVAFVDEGGEIRVVGGGVGGVDRHTPISLLPGAYEVRLQRAWTSELASKKVQD